MTVAIYTDASIYRGAGSWATVIVRPGGVEPVEAAGKLRGRFHSSTATEGAAMANALWFARRHGLVEAGEAVTLYCDNKNIVDRIAAALSNRPWKDAKDPAIMEAARYVLEASATIGISLTMRWVKGHQRLDSPDPHAIHNRRCDQLCSAAREGRPAPSLKMLQDQHAAAQRRRANREGVAA